MSELMTPILSGIDDLDHHRIPPGRRRVRRPQALQGRREEAPIFGETIETPFGPAAGPNTQLAQNIIAGYFAGAGSSS